MNCFQRLEVTERNPIEEHLEESVGKAVCKDSGVVATVNLDKDVIEDEIVEDKTDLDPRVAMVG